MTEKLPSPTPLPEYNRPKGLLGNPKFFPEPPSTIGELVTTDTNDPFVWLNENSGKVKERPSDSVKQVLWALYRMNGNFPVNDQDEKWRDTATDLDDAFDTLTPIDKRYVVSYIKHLARSVSGNSQQSQDAHIQVAHDVIPAPEKPHHETIRLYDPNIQFALVAMRPHIDESEQATSSESNLKH